MTRSFLAATCLLFCLLGYGGAAELQSGGVRDFRPPHLITDTVATSPAAVSWAPDGAKIAFGGEGGGIYDLSTGKKRTIGVPGVTSLAWLRDDRLAVLVQDGERSSILLLSGDGESGLRIPLEERIDSILSPGGGDGTKLLLLSWHFRPWKLGLDVSQHVSVLVLSDRSIRKLYGSKRTFQTKESRQINPALFRSWMHAGVNPLDGSLPVMDQVKPPMFPLHTKIESLDPVSGRAREISGRKGRQVFTSGTWSPDGQSMALSTSSGTIEVMRSGARETTALPLGGDYPSWNPRGSQIYAGGVIVNSDGSGRQELLGSAPRSIGWWSPDGSRLAVATGGGELYLFEGFRPHLLPPDRPLDGKRASAFRLLGELLDEGLITKEEYENRYDKLQAQGERGI